MKGRKYYKWVLVILLWVVALLNYMDRQILSTMRLNMQVDIPELQSAANFGYLMAVFLWVYGFMSPLGGIAADKFSKKWLIVGSLFVWSGVTFGMGYATTFHQVYWLRAIMGLSEALYIPAGLSLIAEFHQKKTRSLAIGIHMTGIYFGQALGGFGATISNIFSWHFTFHYLGMAGILYSLVLVFFLKDSSSISHKKEETPQLETKPAITKVFALLFTNISFWIILFYFAIPSLPGWATKNWLPTLFAENLNIPMSKAGPLSTIALAASSFLGVITGGILSDRWVQKNVRGRIYTSVMGLALIIPSLALIGFGHTLFHTVAAAICFGIGWGMYDANNMPILCQVVSAKYRATAYGIMNMVGVFSGAIITDWLGRSSDEGHLGKDFGMLTFIVLAAMIIMLAFLKPRTNDYTD
ncbi:MAG: MFS transporter [Bacteroidetes bacterium]|nr:MFS transporter [Bacteroidota bacterium]MBS1929977.1 MFS transporter [Bacteroidota bacterium]